MKKLLNFDRVLCLSPHPDDVELSMLGTILKCTDTFFHILCLTVAGAKGYGGSGNDRVVENMKLWRSAGCKNVKFERSKYIHFEDLSETGWINHLDHVIDKGKYDCIFIPPIKDSMLEHRFVNGFGSALVRKKSIALIEYYTNSTLNNWCPNLFIDITCFFKEKIELLKIFESQKNKTYFDGYYLLAMMTSPQCKKKGIKYTEKFRVVETYG